jgi:tryptophan synthase alpha chain
LPITSSEAPRIAAAFAGGRRALIPFLPAGYPSPDATLDLLLRLAGAGADILELGVPFSDPLADGATIQRASQRAIEQGVTMTWTLKALAAFRAQSNVPVVLFSYLNPILAYGTERFLTDAESAGADGVLLTDLPLDADPALERTFESSPLALVRLIAPTTERARAQRIAARSQGFVYYVSRTGVTGATTSLRDDLAAEVVALKSPGNVPIAVGFGISTPEQARVVAEVADGVVVGSALIDALDRGGASEMERLVVAMKAAITP